MIKIVHFTLLFALLLCACGDKKQSSTIVTPWGDTLSVNDTTARNIVGSFSIDDIIANGEIIMLTENGPQTYYEYHGRGLGTQYLIVGKFAETLGVKVRVDVCKDSLEIIKKLENGEGDIAAFQTPGQFKAANTQLADSIKRWNTPALLAYVESFERDMLTTKSVKRHIHSPFKDVGGGVISEYDPYFKRYSQTVGWDWRLVAAQCYQESCFDPYAVSWAGAKGLMQIMPSTAAHLGLSDNEVYDPEKSISAACRLLAELNASFQDIPDPYERQNFILASYNGGSGHIRDAMALAHADGQPDRNWESVKRYVLMLSTPQGYRSPLAKHGYMRGSETVGYVESIRKRYEQYGGRNNNARTYQHSSPTTSKKLQDYTPTAIPQRSTKGNKYKISD